jgi:rhamnosyltransferase
MTKNPRIAAAVVLYFPGKDLNKNIESYFPFVEKLFIVDNTPNQDRQEFQKRDNIKYIGNNENLGIAYALNCAAKEAYSNGFNFLLTMDQDSSFLNNDCEKLIQQLKRLDICQTGILAPNHNGSKSSTEFDEVKSTMTSGNLLNLEAFSLVGGFNEDYFIDYVDHEFSLRLRKNKLKIIQSNRIHIKHKLGDTVSIRLFGRTMASSNHIPVRRYYMTRNRFYTISRFFLFDPALALKELFGHFVETIKIILIERDIRKKLGMSFRGFLDFLKGKYGKYES